MTSAPVPGTPAPDFTLPSTAGIDVSLSNLRGRNVLLAFFPLVFTPVCTQEMCSFTDVYDRFRNANTVLLPISVDSIPTLKKFKAKLSEETPGTTRGNEELLAQLEAHRLSA